VGEVSSPSVDSQRCIVLIDRAELARLMIIHGVGVTPIAVYELKRVDSDFLQRTRTGSPSQNDAPSRLRD